MSQLQKVKKEDIATNTMAHKEFIIKSLRLVQLFAFVSWWQRKVLFRVI
jgi:hypothetical protein